MKNILNLQELMNFTEQFSIILHSGISALEGFNILAQDSTSPKSKELFSFLAKELEESGSFAYALEKSGLFPGSMTTYVKAGEETGNLEEVMESLSRHYEQELDIRQTVKNAVLYPIIMLGMMAVVIVILLVKVLPVFAQVFRQMGMEMNGLSGHLLATGDAITRYFGIFLAIMILILGFILFVVFHPAGRKLFHNIINHIPRIRDIPILLDYGRLTQGISMGLRSGLDPDTSLTLAQNLTSHPVVIERLEKARKLLQEGELFSDALTSSGLFEGINARLISIGLETGSTDDVMGTLSGRYQESSYTLIMQIVSVIEPTIVIIFSLLVGLVLLSVMMPLLGILSEMML